MTQKTAALASISSAAEPTSQPERVAANERSGTRASMTDINGSLAELSAKLARMARQFQFLRIDRVAAELVALSSDLRDLALDSAARSFRHEEPKA